MAEGLEATWQVTFAELADEAGRMAMLAARRGGRGGRSAAWHCPGTRWSGGRARRRRPTSSRVQERVAALAATAARLEAVAEACEALEDVAEDARCGRGRVAWPPMRVTVRSEALAAAAAAVDDARRRDARGCRQARGCAGARRSRAGAKSRRPGAARRGGYGSTRRRWRSSARAACGVSRSRSRCWPCGSGLRHGPTRGWRRPSRRCSRVSGREPTSRRAAAG